MKKLKLLLFLIAFSVFAKAQSYKFDIFAKDEKIGTIESSIIEADNIIKVNILALVKIHFILDEDIRYELNSIYKDNELFFSSAEIFLNNKPHISSIVRKDKDKYIITRNGAQRYFNEIINYSGALLYFIEPNNRKKIFSEIDNIFKDIIKNEEHKYNIVNPKNDYTSFFTYENGILKQANIHHTYMDVVIKRNFDK